MIHSFTSPPNIAILVALVLAMAADAYSTQRFLSPEVEARHGGTIYEINPIARPFVKRGWPGQILISGIGLVCTIAVALLFHRGGHHVIERTIPAVVAGVSGILAFRNMQL